MLCPGIQWVELTWTTTTIKRTGQFQNSLQAFICLPDLLLVSIRSSNRSSDYSLYVQQLWGNWPCHGSTGITLEARKIYHVLSFFFFCTSRLFPHILCKQTLNMILLLPIFQFCITFYVWAWKSLLGLRKTMTERPKML